MSRCLAVLRLLAMGSLGLWAPGCASMYVSSMLPRVDGSAELRLYTASPTLELHKNGGRIAIEHDHQAADRLLWKDGAVRFVGRPSPHESRLLGSLPQPDVPAEQCGPPGAVRPTSARQVEGDPIIWCLWRTPDDQSVRIEARQPFADQPLFQQVQSGPELPSRLEPLFGQRALVTRGDRLWLLHARTRAVQLLIDEPARLRGATPQGDLLVRVQERTDLLLLRTGQAVPLPGTTLAMGTAADAVWLQEDGSERLLRIDVREGTRTERMPPTGCHKLLGADLGGHLWFVSQPAEVRRGQPVPLCRWDPHGQASDVFMIPTATR